METGNLTEIIMMVLGFIVTGFTSVKLIFVKVMRAVDEGEDVIMAVSNVAKESADVLTAIVEAGNPEQDGSVKFTSDEWAKIKKEVKEVKAAAEKVPKEAREAVTAIKAIFRKGP